MNEQVQTNASGQSAPVDGQAITEAIILAGGLGTRLRSAVPDLPKCMAPVAGRPFLGYVIDSLRRQGIERFVFSLGYLSEPIQAWLAQAYPTLTYTCVIEAEPLGTGGGILLALSAANTAQVLVANGDTLFEIDLAKQATVHARTGAQCTLGLKPMREFDRYGAVAIDAAGIVTGFEEKRYFNEGLINGGVYLVDREALTGLGLPQKFSFEKEYLEPAARAGKLAGAVHDGYFIDIGIPEDFARAQRELQAPVLDLAQVDRSWTLLLDRDGVINEEFKDRYVLNRGEFRFSPGVLEAMPLLAEHFGRILVITNQRGVSRGLMSEADLQDVHAFMTEGINGAGGTVHGIYYCTDKDNNCFFRKPNPGMALRAKADFPDIDFRKTIMVGNKPSDMRFGRAAGAFTVFVTSTNPNEPFPHPDTDLRFDSLLDFAKALTEKKNTGHS
ncbi:HAD-IIIA family hydrolase [Flaviaesturariibacter flavus]|uniref:HAD-IIIA family hydrolase n=1 Tax=Flaviaesturariibacter flavus TaxID=2502780 RepID=A0A4V6NB42_9BACT|nr:HAD-IIIA family hydrolase [Flaviaesturariibacter flavus]TCJ19292.1 HAD-IIIA family hydrolase [Flaviaesturariibacter flavus]